MVKDKMAYAEYFASTKCKANIFTLLDLFVFHYYRKKYLTLPQAFNWSVGLLNIQWKSHNEWYQSCTLSVYSLQIEDSLIYLRGLGFIDLSF